MKAAIPYEKLSKKKRQAQNAKRRRDWGNISPVTRRPEDPKVYNRKKAPNREMSPDEALFRGILLRHRIFDAGVILFSPDGALALDLELTPNATLNHTQSMGKRRRGP